MYYNGCYAEFDGELSGTLAAENNLNFLTGAKGEKIQVVIPAASTAVISTLGTSKSE